MRFLERPTSASRISRDPAFACEGDGNDIAALARRDGVVHLDAAHRFDQAGERLALRYRVILCEQMLRLFQRIGRGCTAGFNLSAIAIWRCGLRAGKVRAGDQRKESKNNT